MKLERPPIAPEPRKPESGPGSSPAERPQTAARYTCLDYRREMTLLSLQRRLNDPDLPEAERASLRKDIQRLRAEMGME